MLRVSDVNSSSLTLGSRSVTLDGKSNLLLRYRGVKRTFPYVSAADVLNGSAPAGVFGNKLVLRRHNGAGDARGGRDAARHAVHRGRSAGNDRGQPAPAGLCVSAWYAAPLENTRSRASARASCWSCSFGGVAFGEPLPPRRRSRCCGARRSS